MLTSIFTKCWFWQLCGASRAPSSYTFTCNQLLTLGVHAPEGYGSRLCVCVCLSVATFPVTSPIFMLQQQGCARDGWWWSALATTLKLPTATVLRRPPVGLGLTCSKIYRLFYSALLLNLSYYSPLSSNYSH